MALSLQPFARYAPVSSNTLVKSGFGYLYGVIVTTAVATAQIDIREGTTAGAGNIVLTIPVGAAVGTIYFLPAPIRFDVGLYANVGGTGGINVLFQ